jgi:PKD repeat protein
VTDIGEKRLGYVRLWAPALVLLALGFALHSCGKEDAVTQPTNCAVAEFTATPAAGNRPHTVTFTNLSQPNNADFEWDFGDGGTSTERNPTHEYTTCGSFDVTLQVSADCGSR